MKIENLKPGMTVYDVHRYRMGNTTVSSIEVWEVRIIEVYPDNQTVKASWNGNKERIFYRGAWSKWRVKMPKLISTSLGGHRIAKRGEQLPPL